MIVIKFAQLSGRSHQSFSLDWPLNDSVSTARSSRDSQGHPGDDFLPTLTETGWPLLLICKPLTTSTMKVDNVFWYFAITFASVAELLSEERLSDALAVINDKLTLLAVDDVADNRATNAQAGDREATNAANSIDLREKGSSQVVTNEDEGGDEGSRGDNKENNQCSPFSELRRQFRHIGGHV
eukprot:scaffold4861_cov207-Alexandrium_tamarense.AAC.1